MGIYQFYLYEFELVNMLRGVLLRIKYDIIIFEIILLLVK